MTTTKKNAIRYIDEKSAQVTKAFQKNASIFGTEEFKLWREYLTYYPDAKMVTKSIKKNPNKQTSTKNMTYEHMAIYIRQQDNAVTMMAEFKKQVARSKVQTNPYRCVLAWFKQTFENYDSYKSYFAKLAEEEAKKKDIFNVDMSPAAEDTNEDADDFSDEM